MDCNGVMPGEPRPPSGGDTGLGPRAWIRSAAALAALVIAAAVVLAGCGGGPASPKSAGGGSSRLTGPLAQALEFSRCMRAHGVTGYPDPTAHGSEISISLHVARGSNLNPHSPQNQAARSACRAFLPPGMTAAQKTAANARALRYSQCMRSHGISSYPDPNGQGTISVAAGPGIDPRSPLFQRAQRACQSLDNGFNMNTSNIPN